MPEIHPLDQLDRLAGGLHSCGEVACLTLKLRGVVRSVGNDQRRAQSVDLPLRTHRRLHLVAKVKDSSDRVNPA
jgi:hypothetical protein